MAATPPWTPSPDAGAVLVTASEPLADEVARIAAAAAVPLTVVGGWQEAAGVGAGRTILVGCDRALARGAREGPVILLGLAGESARLWDAAARITAERVAVLPEAAGWLADYLSRSASRTPAGLALGVIGAVGGAGASALSCWLAQAAARRGISTLLIDGDPWGGGLDMVLGAREAVGVRWQDIGQIRGTLNPLQLISSLPAVAGFALLSWSDSDPPAEGHLPPEGAAGAVLDAGRRGHALSVIDLGRSWDAESSLLPYCDRLLLVVPARLCGILAARRMADALRSLPTRAVVRGPRAADLDEHLIAETLGMPLGGFIPHLRGIPAAADRGQLLSFGRHRRIRGTAEALLDSVPGAGDRASR